MVLNLPDLGFSRQQIFEMAAPAGRVLARAVAGKRRYLGKLTT
jgi:hypothetical protein